MQQRFPRRWDKITRINFLQRKMIINAILYYELNDSKLSDKDYDELSKQLVELQKDVDISKTQYGYAMYDFDGTTGFDLYSRLKENDRKYLLNISKHILGRGEKKIVKKAKKGGLF